MTRHGYSPISGAYYSARLAVCEYLKSIRRSARVVVIRSISSDYWAPLGTWVIREAARKAMGSQPVSCATLDVAVTRAVFLTGSGTWVPHSTLIPEMRTQRTLLQFLDAEPHPG
jgi:DNA repair protein NreA